MSKGGGQTLERLYIELGLDLSQLQANILAADKTITENIGRLNREKNTIKIRMEADIAGLDRVVDSAKILEIQEKALNQQLALSKDKLAILEAVYKQVSSNANATSMAVQRAEQAFQKQRLEVAQLEAQLKSLSTQKISLDTTHLQDSIAKLNSKIQHIKIQADIDVSKLQGANAAFDAQKIHISAVTRELELQRQKLLQLREVMYQSARNSGSDSYQTLNIKSNVLQQIQEISRLETKLKELQGMNINLQVRTDSIRQAESLIHDNIARINARIENIKVKTDIDLSKLGTMASEFDKAKTHVQGLNHELDLQKRKLAELQKAMYSSAKINGVGNAKTINLQTEIQLQIQAIDQLKAKINELNKIQPPKTNSLLSGYLNIKGDVVGKLNEISSAFAGLKGATSSADAAITSTLSVIGAIPHPVGRAVAAFAAMPIVLKGVENSIIDMTRAAAASGDAVYVMSRGFQMSIADTGKFTTNAKVAGVQVNDLAMAVKNVQRQVARGGEDSRAAEWLKRYGESAYDASGNLKNLNDMTFALNSALRKAQAEGKGAEFVLNVFRNVSADAITAIEDWVDVSAQAATIIKAGLGNPKLAHEVQGNLNAFNVQSAQLGTSFTNALLPIANEIVPKITERMGRLTNIISENKDMIREFGYTAAEAILKIEEAAEAVGSAFISAGKFFYNLKKNPEQDKLVERFKFDFDIKSIDDLIKKAQPKAYDFIKNDSRLYEQVKAQYQPILRAITDVQAEIKAKQKELEETLATPVSVANFSAIGQERIKFEDDKYLDSLRNARKYQEEADAILAKMNQSDYENKKLDLQRQRNELLRETESSKEERLAIEKFLAAKSAQIEQERADKIAEIRERVEAGDKTALQNKLDTIEKERQAWAKAGMDELESVELAQKQIAKVYEEVNARIQEHIKNAADMEYEMTHTAFEKQIRDIEQWEEAQRQKADTAEEVQSIISESAMKEAQAFEREMERIKGTLQSLEDKVFEQEHSQYENDLRRAQQERIKLYEDFQSKGILDTRTQALIERYYNNSIGKINQRAKESKGGGVGTGIMMINGDQIIGGRLINAQQEQIGLLTDENRLRAQLSQKLDADAQAALARIQATKESIATQKASQQEVGFQLIEGAKVANQPLGVQTQSVLPTTELLKFGEAVQQSTAEIEQVDPSQVLTEPMRAAAEAQKAFAESVQSFPPEYFKNLADSAQSVSEMQLRLTESTLSLIDAQGKLEQSLKTNSSAEAPKNNQTPEGFMQLSKSTQDVQRAQESLSHTARETNNNLKELSQSSYGIGNKKIGFDWDAFSGIAQTGLSALSVLSTLGGMAPIPIIKAGSLILGAATGAGFALGGTGQDLEPRRYADNQQGLMPAEIDLSTLTTPLSSIDTNVQSIAQAVQDSYSQENDRLQELFGTLTTSIEETVRSILAESQGEQSQEDSDLTTLLSGVPKIGEDVQGILQGIQTKENTSEPMDYLTPLSSIDTNIQSIAQAVQVPMTFETVVTPLNNISTVVENILTALNNRQPPQVTISPNNSINLGGAYVFDNAMKQELVNDITSQIVDNITSAVQAATSSSNYGYGA